MGEGASLFFPAPLFCSGGSSSPRQCWPEGPASSSFPPTFGFLAQGSPRQCWPCFPGGPLSSPPSPACSVACLDAAVGAPTISQVSSDGVPHHSAFSPPAYFAISFQTLASFSA